MRRASATRKTAFTRRGDMSHVITVVAKLKAKFAATRAESFPPERATPIATSVPQIAPIVCAKASLRNSIARFKSAVGTTQTAPRKNETERNCNIVATCGSWKNRAAGHEKSMTRRVTDAPVMQLSQKPVDA